MAHRHADYLRDPAAIYRASFAAIRREVALDHLPPDMQAVALRLIHACGMPEILRDLAFSPDAAASGRTALQAGKAVLADATMVASGIVRARLPTNNRVLCTLPEIDATDLNGRPPTTRSAAAVELWGEQLEGAVVAIGNAPTALFQLLELISAGAPRPAVILGFPVGFVGAAEAKEALIAYQPAIPYIALRGRFGGSALAAAAVNALAKESA